nr:MAG TPA: hypothetical protein [Caudoviricetes sp.]
MDYLPYTERVCSSNIGASIYCRLSLDYIGLKSSLHLSTI